MSAHAQHRGAYRSLTWKERLQADFWRRKLLPVRRYVDQGVAKCLEEHILVGRVPSQNMSRETIRWHDQVCLGCWFCCCSSVLLVLLSKYAIYTNHVLS